MKWSREPAAYGAAVVALVSALAAFDFPLFNGSHEPLVIAVVDGVVGLVVALSVRPFAPSAVTYLITALGALAMAYGVNVSHDLVSGINGVVIALVFALTRVQQTPKASPQPLDQVVSPTR